MFKQKDKVLEDMLDLSLVWASLFLIKTLININKHI